MTGRSASIREGAGELMPGGDAALLEAEALLDRRELSRALAAYDRAEASGAEGDRCAAGRWMVHMLRGEFGAAWRQSDGIRAGGRVDPHRFWSGEGIGGKRVIVRCLHGFGDAVQMLRYAPALRARCAELIVEVPPRMLEIAPWFAGVREVVTWGELAPARAPEWDVQVEVMELPYLFRSEVRELPIGARYVAIPAEIRAVVATRMGRRTAPRVGVAWAAGEWNPLRSLPFECVERMVARSGCEFWSLQGGLEAEAWGGLRSELRTRDARECGQGIATLAAVIEQMDIVITVDTLAAHLAGALGRPAWVLLQHAADWRWMVKRADSPWYSSVRLFRQRREGDWAGAVDEVMGQLSGLAQACELVNAS